MARIAFIIGSNGPRGDLKPLKYAKKDATELASVLSGPQCGFSAIVAQETSDPFALQRELFKTAERCQIDDTFIIYFSGHGIINAGSLVLLLDKSNVNELLSTAIRSSDLLMALSASKSQNKLLILDCCNAGTVARVPGLKQISRTPVEELGIKSENHVVLMASGYLESARELDDFKGSFLTKVICEGLTTKFDDADVDHDGVVSLLDVRRWLEKRAVSHNKNYPTLSVPIPQLFGVSRGDFNFTLPVSWTPQLLNWPDDTKMVALPLVEHHTRVTCIGKFPITNKQYKLFVEATGHPEPLAGSTNGSEGFRPWDDVNFNGDDQPVVCVSYFDAVNYCQWVNRSWRDKRGAPRTRLPSPREWDFAAFGTTYPSSDPDKWRAEPILHGKSKGPYRENIAHPTNRRGVCPMLGNVWEWCALEWDEYAWDKAPSDLEDWRYPGEIRGGSFKQNLFRSSFPKLEYDQFPNGINARDPDMGFRIASDVPISDLTKDRQAFLYPSRKASRTTPKGRKKKLIAKWRPTPKK